MPLHVLSQIPVKEVSYPICLENFWNYYDFFLHSAPGPPINLVAQLDAADCTQAALSWDLPPRDERHGISHK